MWASSLCERLSGASPALLRSLLDAAAKGAILLLVTLLVALAMRRAAAAARHLVWFLSTLCLLILPVLSTALPGWRVLPNWGGTQVAAVSEVPPTLPSALEVSAPPIEPALPDAKLLPNYSAPEPMKVLTPAPMPAAAPIAAPAASPIRLNWQGWILIAWLAGALLYLAYVVFGCLSLWFLRRRSPRRTNDGWPELLEQLRRQISFTRSVELIASPQRAMPMTWGLWRTWILLPGDASHWTESQRRAVLLHELAHARRWDCLTQLVTQFACALYWFNPLVWFAWHRMQIERERACDDLVLTTGTKASTYAEQLLQIATEMPAVRFSAAAIAMARPSTLEGRLLAILDVKRNRRALTWGAGVIALTVMAAIATPLAMLRAADVNTDRAAKSASIGMTIGKTAASTQPALAATELGTVPDFGHGTWNMPLIGEVRFRSPNAAYRPGPWFMVANSDLSEGVQVNPLNLGLPEDAPIETIEKKTHLGDIYEPTLGVIVPIRGSLMAPLKLPTEDGEWKRSFREGIELMTCQQIAQQVIAFHTANPKKTEWHVKDGEHYAILRSDGGLSVIDVHGGGDDIYLTIIPIGAVALPATTPATAPVVRTVAYRRYAADDATSAEKLMAADDGRQRVEEPDGSYFVRDAIQGKQLFVNPAKKTAVLSRTENLLVDDPMFSVANIEKLADPGQGAFVSLGTTRNANRETQEIEFSAAGLKRLVWRDAATHRPAKIQIELPADPPIRAATTVVLDNIVFDAPLDDSALSLQPPAGYQVTNGVVRFKTTVLRVPATKPTEQAGATTLDFRIAGWIDDNIEKPTGSLFPPELAKQYVRNLEASGPHKIDGFDWFETDTNVRMTPFSIVGTHGGKKYVLLATTDPYIMLTEREGPRSWGLTRVRLDKDSQGKPAIVASFDPPGAERFGKLTEANLKRPLAFLIDDKVVCMATIQTKIASSVMFPFWDGQDSAEARQVMQSLSRGMPPALIAAAKQPELPATNPAAATRPAGLNADQQLVLEWTNREFRQFFDARKFTGWSDQDRQNLEARCIDALSGPQDQEYYQAINTLGALKSTKALPKLRELAFERRDKNNRDRWMSVRVLGLMGDKESVPQLIHLVYHGNSNTHWWAQISLVWLTGQNFGSDWQAWGKWWTANGGQPPFDATMISWYAGQPQGEKLAQTLAEQDRQFLTQLRGGAAPATNPSTAPDKLGAADAVRSAIATISTCADGDPRIATALGLLKGVDEPAAVTETVKYLSSEDDNTRRAALYVLWRGGFKSVDAAVDPLIKLCGHKEDTTRGMSALALGASQAIKSESAITEMATGDKSAYARRCAAFALGFLGDPKAVPVLGKLTGDPDRGVSENAKAAIKMLLGAGPRG